MTQEIDINTMTTVIHFTIFWRYLCENLVEEYKGNENKRKIIAEIIIRTEKCSVFRVGSISISTFA